MSTVLRGLALTLAIASLGGCAAAPYKAMSPALRSQVTATNGVVGVGQSEIKPTIQTAGAPGGGLIGALIGSSIDNSHLKTAEKTITPLRNALLGYDFDGPIQAAMQTQLPKVDWLHLTGVSLVKDTGGLNIGSKVKDAQTPYTLVVDVEYHLSPDFDTLVVTAFAHLIPKSKASQNADGSINYNSAVYDETVTYESIIPDGAVDALQDKAKAAPTPAAPGMKVGDSLSDDDTAVQYWSQDDAAAAKTALNQGISEVSRILAMAMQSSYSPVTNSDDAKVHHQYGHLIEQGNNNRALIQLDDGTLISTDISQVDRKMPLKH